MKHSYSGLAEELLVDSYLDTGDRAAFANGGLPVTLHPVRGEERRDACLLMDALGCARLRVEGPEVSQMRARLDENAATSFGRKAS